MSALHYHWEHLQPRERRILTAGSMVTALLLFYALVWEPLNRDITRLEKSIASQRITLVHMQQAAAEVHVLRSTAGTSSDSRSLLSLSDAAAKSHRLTDAVKRIQPDGQQTVRFWLEGAAFDDLLRWLDILSAQGIRITAINIERVSATPGRVNARITLVSSP